MKKCDQKTEVYSRVCGYFRPVECWNIGKSAEFSLRKYFLINHIKEENEEMKTLTSEIKNEK